jgi:hypothetical protein
VIEQPPVIPAEPEEEARPFSEFRDEGLLWLVNVTVFHPRGYALAFGIDTEGNVNGWKLMGDGTEPWAFATDDATRASTDALFARMKAAMP